MSAPRDPAWIDLGPADLAAGELRGYSVDDEHVLVAEHGGRLHALDDLCLHAGCLLSEGWIDARKAAVVCPCHEYTFELASGRNVTVPRLCEDQPVRPLRVEGGRIYIRLE